MSYDNVNESTKVCNICNIEKPIDAFRVHHRHCKACRYEINKAYSKKYYQQHKARLIKMNLDNYRIRTTSMNPNGRPRIYNQESEGISLSR